jgi:hypothetical protein
MQVKAFAAGLSSAPKFTATGPFADISLPFLDLACSLTTLAGLFFKLFRQSIALSTKQAANTAISLAPYFTSNGSARKVIQAKIANDFTNCIIAESGLSGVTWSISPDDINKQVSRHKRYPKDKEGYSKFEEMEKEFHATDQQLSDAQPVAPSESVTICPNCGDTLPNEHALYMHSHRNFAYCQGKRRECQASGSLCDLTRSTGPCTSCRSSGKACHLNSLKSWHNQSPWQCSKCLWRYAPRNPRSRHNEESCIGRCNRCEVRDLPCRVFSHRDEHNSNPSGNTDCIFCLQFEEKCVRMPVKQLALAKSDIDEGQMDEGGMDESGMGEGSSM